MCEVTLYIFLPRVKGTFHIPLLIRYKAFEELFLVISLYGTIIQKHALDSIVSLYVTTDATHCDDNFKRRFLVLK